MQIKLDPSTDDAPHSIDIPALTIEGREQAERIVAMINKHAAALWPKPRVPRARKLPFPGDNIPVHVSENLRPPISAVKKK